MSKIEYAKPAVRTYGGIAELTLWGTIERATGLSSGQILKKIPSEYRDQTNKFVNDFENKYGDKLTW